MITTILNPADLPNASRAQVVILDVLRATSSIVTSLAAGTRQIHLYDSLDAARAARNTYSGTLPVLLAGELKCLKPDDFDLGNSPRDHVTHKVGNNTILLSTTNGTRAAVRAQAAGAQHLYAASLLNASATAQALIPKLDSHDTFLVCAGTDGQISLEDILGAGAILFSLLQQTYRTNLPFTDTAWLAYHAFTATKPRLNAALRLGQGGINLLNAGLEDDIDACAKLDSIPLVAQIDPINLVVRRI
ncbi:MAG TPA: 2-phosphosulfolactate phosphatase [Phycisphaerae bacterium]|jgi:2-phosphosulfolactate phosphatase